MAYNVHVQVHVSNERIVAKWVGLAHTVHGLEDRPVYWGGHVPMHARDDTGLASWTSTVQWMSSMGDFLVLT
jgi:hypothetical protein